MKKSMLLILLALSTYVGSLYSDIAPTKRDKKEKKRLLVDADLRVAVRNGTIDEIQHVLLTKDSESLNINALDKEGICLLTHAVSRSEPDAFEIVQLLIDTTKVDVDNKQCKIKPLYKALSGGSYETAKLLLENGAKANTGPTGTSALLKATYSTRGDVSAKVQLLLDHGANPLVHVKGSTPLDYLKFHLRLYYDAKQRDLKYPGKFDQLYSDNYEQDCKKALKLLRAAGVKDKSQRSTAA